ncbi:unnamed protein product [marine sediment metagenome]|uniref:Uncharacterized protein n=1 Tax=marine sediment metagenome TaxID=412755 RepID=X0Z3H3_9ZZZZ
MKPENLVEEMNKALVKMDRELKSLNKELDKILKKYPRYLAKEETKLRYAMYKYNHGK